MYGALSGQSAQGFMWWGLGVGHTGLGVQGFRV